MLTVTAYRDGHSMRSWALTAALLATAAGASAQAPAPTKSADAPAVETPAGGESTPNVGRSEAGEGPLLPPPLVAPMRPPRTTFPDDEPEAKPLGDPHPPSGTPFLVVGGSLAGGSLIVLLGTALACGVVGAAEALGSIGSPSRASGSSDCTVVGATISGSMLVSGFGLLVAGGIERHEYNVWRAEHPDFEPRRKPTIKVIYEHASLLPVPGGVGIGWGGVF
jgi:hypothetical protein